MTNIEYVRAIMGVNYPLDDAFFTATLTGNGIDPESEFVKGKEFDIALANSLIFLLASAERISEGGYTVQLNLDAIRSLISLLFNRWGLPDPLAERRLIDITNQW